MLYLYSCLLIRQHAPCRGATVQLVALAQQLLLAFPLLLLLFTLLCIVILQPLSDCVWVDLINLFYYYYATNPPKD